MLPSDLDFGPLQGWSLLVAQMAAPAWIKLPSLEYFAINQSGAALSNNSPEEMRGYRATRFYGSQIGAQYDDSDRLAIQAGRTVVSIDSGLREGGRWCETVKTPLFAHGTLVAVVGVARAISSVHGLVSALLSAQGQRAASFVPHAGDLGDSAQEPWLRRTKELMDADPTATVSISSMAEMANVHPDHLSRAFRRCYGISLRDYRKTSRLCWAARALLERPAPLREVAAAAGFADQSHMTRAFVAAFGFPPRQFRERFTGLSRSR